jgi:hypothetical protein
MITCTIDYHPLVFISRTKQTENNMRDQIEQDEITMDQNGSIYPQPKLESVFLDSVDDGLLHGDDLIADYDNWLLEQK